MGWMLCRTGCGAHRSTTACSVDGEHIPECYKCKDPAYLDTWPKEEDNEDPRPKT